jgi:hypothetical protein
MVESLEHNKKLSYDPHSLARTDVDSATFRCWSDGEDLYASGPCPRCHASDQQGHMTRSAPVLGALVEKLVRPFRLPGRQRPRLSELDNPDLPMACQCDSHHGRKDDYGCGARWVLSWTNS